MIEPPRERKVRLLTESTENTGIIVDIIHFILAFFVRLCAKQECFYE